MNLKLKVCVYEVEKGIIEEHLNQTSLNSFGFDYTIINGGIDNVFAYMSANSIDIFVVSNEGLIEERFNFLIDIVYNNFCKNILVLSSKDLLFEDKEKIVCLQTNNASNLDLKISSLMLKLRKNVEQEPCKNLPLIKAKITDILSTFMFSSRHIGFKYYVEAVTRAFIKQPYDYSTMELYKEIAEKYDRTIYSIEKNMRTALLYAFNKIKQAPLSTETRRLKNCLTYDMTNNTAISMLLTILIQDDEICPKDQFGIPRFYQ